MKILKVLINSVKNNPIRFIYLCVGVLLSALFIKILYSQIINSFFEEDPLAFIPWVIRHAEGLSAVQLIGYFLKLLPLAWGSPSLRSYCFITVSLLGPLARNLIFVSLVFHFFCAALVFLLAKKFDLSFRVGFLSALMYLTFFAHFHAYMWPMSFQHIAVIFSILLVINFYLKTDRLIISNDNYRRYYVLTLTFNLLASFCRTTILLLPILIIVHILFCSKDAKERIKKYDIWLPLFAAYLIFPLITFAYGDEHLFMFFYNWNIPIFAKFLILFSSAALCLLILRGILRLRQRRPSTKTLKTISIISLVVIGLILIKTGGPKRLLIPYNLIAPFAGILASFLRPLQNALLIDSTRRYYYIPLEPDAFIFILGLLIGIIFIKKFVIPNRAFLIFIAWYIVAQRYLYLRDPLVSRYFIYLSPIFCIIFCAVLDYLYAHLINLTKLKKVTKEIVLVVLFIILCIPNLFAIRLALFKDRLVGTFVTYDYIRAAILIRQDFFKYYKAEDVKTAKIYLNNVMPLIFTDTPKQPASDYYNDNLKFVFMQVFNDTSIKVMANINPDNDERFLTYSLNGDRIENAQGLNISTFSQLFDAAKNELRLNHYEEATDLFIKAAKERPFLFNYLLPKLELDDLEWITNGNDIRSWVNKMKCSYCYPYTCAEELARVNYVTSIMNREIDDYAQCLSYLSYLTYLNGKPNESRYWLAKIRFLDNYYNSWLSWLSQDSLMKSDKRMLSFLNYLNNFAFCTGFNDYANRYKFEKFLFKLVFKI